MMKTEITFDRFARILLSVAGVIAAYFCIRSLSGVLLPFFIAWLLAYLIYPLVTFFQYKCRLHFRIPCIVLALLVFLVLIGGVLLLVVPPTIREVAHLRQDIVNLMRDFGDSPIAAQIDMYLQDNFDETSITKLFQDKDMMDIVQMGVSRLWGVLTNVFSVLRGLVGGLLVLLYLFFILMDYEAISEGVVNLVPKEHRHIASVVMKDVQHNMNAYFRGQALIALIVGVLFSIGFNIVGLPMAWALGMFIGVLNLVPYLQMLGILPAFLLAYLQSTQTGENFWLIIFYCFIVFLVVQGTQDIILTPRIMGKIMGLKPALILLSLSVWGYLLGFIGLIIALPFTTLILSYYKFFVLKEKPKSMLEIEKKELRARKN